MIKWHKLLFIILSLLITTLTLQKWLYRTVVPRNRPVSFERLMTNLTVNNILQCDQKFLPDIEAMSKSGYYIALENHSLKFTVLMRTYDRRNSIQQAVQHYVCMPSVDRLVLLWSNQNRTLPSAHFFGTKCPEKFVVKAMPSADLTLRFYPFEEIRTDGVFSVDDDILMSEKDLEYAFGVWKRYSWGLVGPYQRAHSDNSPSMTYVSGKNAYSLILTGAVFLHREYLRMFQDKCVAKIREDIDRNNNCEDIFMNFLVKDHCRCSGIFYPKHGRIAAPKNLITKNALSSRPNHYRHRSKCLQKYSALFANSVKLAKSKCTY